METSQTLFGLPLAGPLDNAYHTYASWFVAAWPRLATAAAIVALTGVISGASARISRFFMTRVGMRYALIEALTALVFISLWIRGSLITSSVAFSTVTPADLLTALGLGSIAIGFAFKDIFENFLAGFLILLRESFALGDQIEQGSIEGSVERISVRETAVRQTDGQLVVVPNAALFQNPVTVRTNRGTRRTSIICGIGYGENADCARDVIHDAVVSVDSVRDDVRDVQVFAHAFGSPSVDFEIACWTGSQPVDIRRSRDEVVRAVKRALDREGIEIPFPQRAVTMVGKDTADG